MKLHLPQSLRTALLACVSGLVAIGSTLGTGAVAGGAFVAFVASEAMADLTVTQTVGDVATTLTGTDGVYTLTDDSASISISATEDRDYSVEIKSANGTEEGTPVAITLNGNADGYLLLGDSAVLSLSATAGTLLTSSALGGIWGATDSHTSSADLTVGSGVTLNFTKDNSSGVNLSASTLTINTGGVVNTNVLYTSSGGNASTINIDGGALTVYKGMEIGRDHLTTVTVSNGGTFTATASTFKGVNNDEKSAVHLTITGADSSMSVHDIELNSKTAASSVIVSEGATLSATSFVTMQGGGAHTFTVDGGTATVGSLTANSGNVVSVLNNGALTLTNLTLNDNAKLTNSGTVNLNGTLVMGTAAEFTNSGTLTLGANFKTTLTNSGTSDGLITYTTGIINSGGTIDASALKGSWSVDATSGALVFTSHDLSYNGTTEGDASALTWSQEDGNTFGSTSYAYGDTVTFSGNTVATLGSNVYAAAVTVNDGASLALSSGGYSLSTGNLTLGGTLQIDSVAALNNVDVITTSGTNHKLVLNVNDASMTSTHKFDVLRNHYSGVGSTLELSTGRYRLDAVDKSWGTIVVNNGAQLALNTQSNDGYTGNITITGNGNGTTGDSYDKYGALKLYNGAKIASTSTVTVTKGGASLVVWADSYYSDTASIAAALVLDGDLTKVSGGTLNLSGGTRGAGALHLASGTVNISGASLAHTGGTYLDGGTLGLAAGYTNAGSITLTKNSNLTGGKNSIQQGTITSTAGNLTVSSSSDATAGAGTAFYLSGDINLGTNSLIVSGGVVSIGNSNNAENSASLTMKDIQVNAGTLQIYRKGGTVDSGIVLNGGNIHVEAMADNTGSLSFNSLEVKQNATLSNTWGTTLGFATLTGTANLTLKKGTNIPTLTFGKLSDYTGTLSGDYTVTINSAHQDREKTATISATSQSSSDFVKTGEGSVSFSDHTAEGSFEVKAGTLVAGTLTMGNDASLSLTGGTLVVGSLSLGDNASLSLTGGHFATSNTSGLTIDKAVTLGAVTLGTGDAANGITISGATTFTGTATNTVALSLTGGISVAMDDLINFSHSENGSYVNINGDVADSSGEAYKSGFLSTTYTLITGSGDTASLNFGNDGTSDITTTDITVGSTKQENGLTAANGGATFSAVDTSTYYLNGENAQYDSATMGSGKVVVSQNGELSFGSGDSTTTVILAGGNLKITQDQSHSSAAPITLMAASDGSTSENAIYSSNNYAGVRTAITGEGNLTFKGSGKLDVYETSDFEGNLTISGVTVNLMPSDAAWIGSNTAGKMYNTGSITVTNGGTLRFDQSDQLAKDTVLTIEENSSLIAAADYSSDHISLKGGVIKLSNNTLSGSVELISGTNTISGASASGSTFSANVTGTGNLQLETETVDDQANRILSVTGAIGNTGSVTANKGKVTLKGGASLANTTSLVVEGGTLTIDATAGDIASKNLSMSSGSLILGKELTLTGGAKDTSGNAVDTLVLTGGTLAASTAVTLGYDATLGGVTIGDGTNTGAITIGAAGTTTTFNSAITNKTTLKLDGQIQVSDLSKLKGTEVSRAEGTNGYNYTSYVLVNGEGTSSLELVNSSVTINSTLASGVVAGSNVVASGGGATIATAESTYHVADATEGAQANYADISGNAYGIKFDTIAMEGGKLSVATGEQVAQGLTVSAESTISGAAGDGNAHTGILGDITGTANLIINSAAGTPSNSSTHSDYFGIAGNVNLGSKDLVINTGLVRLGSLNEGTNDNNASITAGNIVVNKGATLEIFRQGAYLGATVEEPTVATTGLKLNGGTLHVQQVPDSGTLAFGTLTVTNASDGTGATLTGAGYSGKVSFTSLTGTGNLTVTGNSNATIATVANYTGKLSQNGGTLNLNGGTLGGEVAVSGGTLNFAGSNIEGKTSVSGGWLNLNSGNMSGEVEVSGGGNFKVSNGATVSNTVKAGEMVTPNGSTEAQFVASATIAGKNDSNATFSGVTVEHNKIWGGTLKGAEVTVDNTFAIEGVTVQDCTFTINSALHMTKNSNTTTTMDSATVVDISSAGSLTNETSAALVLGSGSSLELNTGKAALVNNIDFNGRLMSATVITTSQLAGEFSGSITLEGLTSYLNTLGDAATNVLLVFDGLTMPSTQMAAYGLSTLSDEGTGSAASSVTLNGLTFTLDSALANYSFADQTKLTDKDYAGKTFVLLTTNSDGNPTTAIPEPTTATLSLLALAALCARRRRSAK